MSCQPVTRPTTARASGTVLATLVSAGIALAGLTAVGLAGAPAAAAAPAPASLSITVTDGATQVRSDTDITYTVKLTNGGSATVTETILLSTPNYVTITHVPGGTARKHGAAHEATWTITAPAARPSRGKPRRTSTPSPRASTASSRSSASIPARPPAAR